MKYLWQILIGYLLATPLTDKVELNLVNTEWTNILTYVWIIGSFAVWAAFMLAILGIITAATSK